MVGTGQDCLVIPPGCDENTEGGVQVAVADVTGSRCSLGSWGRGKRGLAWGKAGAASCPLVATNRCLAMPATRC